MQHEQLVDAIGLKAIKVAQKIRRFDAGRPDYQLCRERISVFELHTGSAYLGDL